ncbi:hypothetical protein ACFJGW_14895 [Burkholderiaceae bacterium UC74_6]
MADQLDAADRADFMDALDKARACMQSRNFSCSEAQLKKASRLAHGSGDKRRLAEARDALSAEQAQAAEEVRLQAAIAEQEQNLAEAEAQLRAAEARARQAEQESQPSTASQLLQFGALVAQNYAANKAGAAAAAQGAKLPLADLSADRQRIADQRAKLAAAKERAEAARQANAQAAQARVAQAREQQASARVAAARTNLPAAAITDTTTASAAGTPATNTTATKAAASTTRSTSVPPMPTGTLSAQAAAAQAAPPATGGSSATASRAQSNTNGQDLPSLKLTTTTTSTSPGNGTSVSTVSPSGGDALQGYVDPLEARWKRLLAMPKKVVEQSTPVSGFGGDQWKTEAQARAAVGNGPELFYKSLQTQYDLHVMYTKLISKGPLVCRSLGPVIGWGCFATATVEVVDDGPDQPTSTISK